MSVTTASLLSCRWSQPSEDSFVEIVKKGRREDSSVNAPPANKHLCSQLATVVAIGCLDVSLTKW
jgi:hypothetical protein